ncbi:MAG: bifunctional pyr operon transcriptional regulator/uracil phosphoribosyltransferase PyrR [Clostridia bacterium]|nr:bifunctional pyr operon transcriptional regulator/uracil phosphoribosyltransferase PyrR [Clostridia bacterium]
MKLKSEIMNEAEVTRSLTRITHEIIERNCGISDIVLLGIKRRGLPLAQRISANMLRFEGAEAPVGFIDVTLYRDDLSETTDLPDAGETFIPADINGKCCVLVDDVIFTGRTARAAIEAIFAHGRPARIQLAVLVDRGHRELPIRPDFVGKNIPTARNELIAVTVPEIDGEQYGVKLYER